jgi:hypothetical protein
MANYSLEDLFLGDMAATGAGEGNLNQAAFGVYPQMTGRRRYQDAEAAKNVPVDVLRGRLAGTLGAFGDVVNQPIPMVRPLQLLSQGLTKQDKYADTDYFLKNLPLKNEAPVNQLANRIGSFVPMNPAPVGEAMVDAVKRAGKDFAYASALGVPHVVTPTGRTMMTRNSTAENPVMLRSGLDKTIAEAIIDAKDKGNLDREAFEALSKFWSTKGKNYYTHQFGSPNDPIWELIKSGKLNSPALREELPTYLIDQLKEGKTRVSETGESRFFPKYPEAHEDAMKAYDKLTGIRAGVVLPNTKYSDPTYGSLLSEEGKTKTREFTDALVDKLIQQGVPAHLINQDLEVLAPKHGPIEKGKERSWVNEHRHDSLVDLLHSLEQAKLAGKDLLSTGAPQNVITALQKEEPIFDFSMNRKLKAIHDPSNINEFLLSLPPKELGRIRFEDAVVGGSKIGLKKFERENLAKNIRAGKPVDDKYFTEGVSEPLMTIGGGPNQGYTWKRITDPEATVAEGAWLGHSVGGYSKGGVAGGHNYGPAKHKEFVDGTKQVYTLRDTKNRPVTTVEVTVNKDGNKIISQIKGNGKFTGNTAPEKYNNEVLQFLTNELKPVAITEGDSYLTASLKNYKDNLNNQKAASDVAARETRIRGELGLDNVFGILGRRRNP